MFENYSLWDKLKNCHKPIFMYGTGNGGDKIISALSAHKIDLTGIFASDGFVRDRYFHNFKVRSYSDVVMEYGEDIVILLAFGTTLPDVTAFIEKLNDRHELIIPDVPLYGGDLFDGEYFKSHQAELISVRDMFADEESKMLFDDVVNFRLTGKLDYLRRTSENTVIIREMFEHQAIANVLDGGAFKGDSTADFVSALSPEKIYAIEADAKTHAKLSDYARNETRCEIIPIHAALWDNDCELSYVSSGSRGSGRSGQNKRAQSIVVPARTIDSICENFTVDLIKLDIEGAEREAIRGANSIILRDKPNMAVSLYHRTEDIITLPLSIKSLLPEHSLYLRRVPCIPMWDLTLYAIKKQQKAVT